MDNFFLKKTFTDDELHISLFGNIDENAEFIDLEFSSITKIIINLEMVKAISSNGVRSWLKWVGSTPEDVKIILAKCPKIIVDQLNMVAGFLPKGASVESFYIPYFNQDTGNEKMILVQEGREYTTDNINIAEEIFNPESGEKMELDVIEESYFKFLK